MKEKAEHIATLCEHIASFESDDIDCDSVEIRFEDTGCDVYITETIGKAAEIIRGLLAELATSVIPPEPTPEILYAMWAHRQDMRGQSENEIAKVSYQRLYQVLNGTAQPQSEWGRPSKYGIKP